MRSKYFELVGNFSKHPSGIVKQPINTHTLEFKEKQFMPEIVGIAFQKELSFTERINKISEIVNIKQF